MLQDHTHKVVEEDVCRLRGELGEGLEHNVERLQTACLHKTKVILNVAFMSIRAIVYNSKSGIQAACSVVTNSPLK